MLSTTDVWIGSQEGCTGTSCTTDMYQWNGARGPLDRHTWVNTEPGLAFTGTDAFALNALARVPGRSTLWAVGEVQHTPTSKVWDSLIARYP